MFYGMVAIPSFCCKMDIRFSDVIVSFQVYRR
jgi:hypothetical protein